MNSIRFIDKGYSVKVISVNSVSFQDRIFSSKPEIYQYVFGLAKQSLPDSSDNILADSLSWILSDNRSDNSRDFYSMLSKTKNVSFTCYALQTKLTFRAGDYEELVSINPKVYQSQTLMRLIQNGQTCGTPNKKEDVVVTSEFISQIEQNELSKDEIVKYLKDCL